MVTLGSRSLGLSVLSPRTTGKFSNPFDLFIIHLILGIFNIVYHIHEFQSNIHKRMLSILLSEESEICQEISIEPFESFSKVFIYFL